MAQTKQPQASEAPPAKPVAKTTPTVFCEVSRVVGNVEGAEDLRVCGEVEGQIVLHDADLFIEATAVVGADLQARNVWIAGAVVGNVSASERIVLDPTARVIGDIRAPRLSISEGSAFRGAIETADSGDMREVAQSHAHAVVNKDARAARGRVQREVAVNSARASAPQKSHRAAPAKKKAPKKRVAPRVPRGKHKVARP
ncbi:MAG: bactofilin family protein [Nannocystaceae bacterium]